MKYLREGYTTGSCVASGVKVALEQLINKKNCDTIEINSLNGKNIIIPIERVKIKKDYVIVVIKKDAGDDPDVTNGISICVKVRLIDEFSSKKNTIIKDKYMIVGGYGVGQVTKKGLQVDIGQPAINLGPQKMIEMVVNEYIEKIEKKLEITVFVPQGRSKAQKTFNPKLGIIGGISILGSTGIVKPMSEEALKKSLYIELKVLKEAKNKDWIIFTFGNYSKAFCQKLNLDEEQGIVISNYVGYMLDSAVELGFKKIILLGHIAKAIKIAGGIFNTHSKVADARMEIMGANALLFGEKKENVLKILEANTIEESCDYIENREFFSFICDKVSKKIKGYLKDENIECEVLLFSFKGDKLGQSEGFDRLVGEISEKN